MRRAPRSLDGVPRAIRYPVATLGVSTCLTSQGASSFAEDLLLPDTGERAGEPIEGQGRMVAYLPGWRLSVRVNSISRAVTIGELQRGVETNPGSGQTDGSRN